VADFFPLQFPRDAAASGHVGRAATTAALARGKFGNRAQLSVRAAAPHARARGTLVARILSAAGWPERPVAAVEFACSPVIEMSNGHLDGHRAGRHGCPPSDFRSKKIDAAKFVLKDFRFTSWFPFKETKDANGARMTTHVQLFEDADEKTFCCSKADEWNENCSFEIWIYFFCSSESIWEDASYRAFLLVN